METHLKVVICVVGPSGTGKSYLADYLKVNYNIPLIESRTTRNPRYEGESGHTFVSEKEFDSYKQEDMLAFTTFGDSRYCCLQQDVPDGISSYVIDEFGLQYFRKHFSHKMTIFAVRVFANDELIKERTTEERRSRDEGKFTLSADHFDYFIDNDYSENMYKKYDALYERINKL